jgi:hypothetical protein
MNSWRVALPSRILAQSVSFSMLKDKIISELYNRDELAGLPVRSAHAADEFFHTGKVVRSV